MRRYLDISLAADSQPILSGVEEANVVESRSKVTGAARTFYAPCAPTYNEGNQEKEAENGA